MAKFKAKRLSKAQLSAAQKAGAKVKVEPQTVKLVGIEELLASAKETQAQQAKVVDLVQQSLVMLLNRAEQPDRQLSELVESIKELAKSLAIHAARPAYHFSAERTETGFEIMATPQSQTKH